MAKIKNVVNVIRSSEGGAWIIPQLIEISNHVERVFVILPDATGGLAQKLKEVGIEVIESCVDLSNKKSLLWPLNYLKFRRQLRSLRPDAMIYQLIQTAVWCRLSVIGLNLWKIYQVPGPLYLENPILKFLEKFACRLDDVILVGSNYTRNKYLDLGVKESKLIYIHFGVDLDRFKPLDNLRKRKLRSDLKIGESNLVFIMAAYAYAPKKLVFRGKGIKGHETLIEAWSKFSNRYSDVTLILVGDSWPREASWYRNSLEQKLESHSRKGSFRWITEVTDVCPYYGIADVSISPSLSENHGASLEAGASGVPSIISNAGALRETLPNDWGWIFDAGDSIDLLKKMELAYEANLRGDLYDMGTKARKFVEEKFDVMQSKNNIRLVISKINDV
jgi:glycosyltransferase involved in cell wall biosynthesis